MHAVNTIGGRLLIIAIIFGIAADLLLRETPWGLNVLLVALLGIGAAALLARWGNMRLEGDGRWLAVAIVVFALGLVWRDSPTLTVANAGALLVASTLAALTARVGQVRLAGVTQYLLGVSYVIGYALAGLTPLLVGPNRWRTTLRTGWTVPAFAAGRGVLVALPPLVVFASLFAAADAEFERFLGEILDLDLQTTLVRVGLMLLYAWLLSGVLREMLLAPERSREWTQPPSRLGIGTIELAVVLGLIDLLFATFVVFQLPYLFGGQSQAATLGYSAYARRGFFELVWVAGLSLPLLLLLHWLIRKASPVAERLYRVLALFMVGLLFLVIASAVQRMLLYVTTNGLTELRVQASAFMAWLAVVLVWFAFTVLRGQRRRFAFGALMAGFVTVGMLNVVNPDALIVRTNAAYGALLGDNPSDERPLASVSADATPAIVEALPTLAEADRHALETRLLRRWPAADGSDWRSFNWSRLQAQAAVASIRPN